VIRCIIFDFDGTLVHSNDIKRQSFFDVTRHLSGSKMLLEKKLADPDAGDRFSIFRYLSEHLKENDGSSCDAIELVDRYTALCEEKIVQAPEVNGATDMLAKFSRNGLKLAVSSATPEDALKKLISLRGLDSFFSVTLGAPASKEKHIEEISNNWQLDPTEMLYVGDSEVDKMAALNTGCHFIGVGKNHSRFNERPEKLIEDLRDLPMLIKKY
jgi:phosphoglycolate phosphatase